MVKGRAADSIVIGECWYHFRHGKLRRNHVSNIKWGYFVEYVGRATQDDVDWYQSLVGSGWRPWATCFEL